MRLAAVAAAAAAAAALAGCSPFAVTPPARTFALDSPITPPVGHGDVQLDIASSGQPIFGPTIDSAGGQLRTTIAPNTTIVAGAERMSVENASDQQAASWAYAGRVGAVLATDDHRAAFTFGAGGGTAPAAGSWGSIDFGGVVTGKNHWIRPLLALSVGYNAPLSRRPFTITDSDGEDPVTLQLPSDIMVRVDFGLELGPPRCALIAGVSGVHFWMLEPDVISGNGDPSTDEGFMMLGLATRISLD
ncbi:MAG TPA: hypothetical protein VGF94_12230 [Kofleriaceae bacterium]|jgi:hypothetical protein